MYDYATRALQDSLGGGIRDIRFSLSWADAPHQARVEYSLVLDSGADASSADRNVRRALSTWYLEPRAAATESADAVSLVGRLAQIERERAHVDARSRALEPHFSAVARAGTGPEQAYHYVMRTLAIVISDKRHGIGDIELSRLPDTGRIRNYVITPGDGISVAQMREVVPYAFAAYSPEYQHFTFEIRTEPVGPTVSTLAHLLRPLPEPEPAVQEPDGYERASAAQETPHERLERIAAEAAKNIRPSERPDLPAEDRAKLITLTARQP